MGKYLYKCNLAKFESTEKFIFIKKINTIEKVENIKESLLKEVILFKKELNCCMWDMDEAKKRLVKEWLFYILKEKDRIFGWVWFDTNENILLNGYINKDYRNKNYGKKFMIEAMTDAKMMGRKKLIAYIDDWNIHSQKMVENLGWKRVGSRIYP